MNLDGLITRSLSGKAWQSRTARIITAALEAADPRNAVLSRLRRVNDLLFIDGEILDLNAFESIYVIGAGKAGEPMVNAVNEVLGELVSEGLVIVKQGYAEEKDVNERIQIIDAGHPYPDDRGIKATENIIKILKKTRKNDLVLCLISGGGSALMVSPVSGVSLDDLQTLTAALLASGATINEINVLRKHLDKIKGGNLAQIASPAKLVSLILSDVVGDHLDVIASGPTVPDPTTYIQAVEIISKYNFDIQVPAAVMAHLNRGIMGELYETPKPGDEIFANVTNVVIASNKSASQAALHQAEIEGFNSMVLSNFMQGEANQVGLALSSILRQIAIFNQPIPRPACLIIGGETTVTLHGEGKGGRNQELALAAVKELSGLEDISFITLATDGGDGPTDAAGAVVTGETFLSGEKHGLNPSDYLIHNDAYNYFKPLDDLIIIGPTKTNVNDLIFMFAY